MHFSFRLPYSPYTWLLNPTNGWPNRHLGELEGLGTSKRDLKAAWFNALLEYFRSRKKKLLDKRILKTAIKIGKKFHFAVGERINDEIRQDPPIVQ